MEGYKSHIWLGALRSQTPALEEARAQSLTVWSDSLSEVFGGDDQPPTDAQ